MKKLMTLVAIMAIGTFVVQAQSGKAKGECDGTGKAKCEQACAKDGSGECAKEKCAKGEGQKQQKKAKCGTGGCK